MAQEDEVFLSNGNSQEAEGITFEDILECLGHYGKFQIIQCTLCLTPMLMLTFMGLGFVFIGYTPPHECARVNETELFSKYNLLNDSTAKVAYRQCDITVSSNQSGHTEEIVLSCPNGYRFPTGKHSTLVSEWDLVCDKTGLVETAQLLYTLGNILGGLFVPSLADRFGRRPVFCITTMLSMLIEFGITFAPNMYVVCTALFVDGIIFSGVAATYLVMGMEILIARYRQLFGIVACMYWVLCVLIVGWVGYIFEFVGWRYFQATGALTGLLALPVLFFLYESPRWLAINGRRKEALAILNKASKQNGKDFAVIKKMFEKYMDDTLTNTTVLTPVTKCEKLPETTLSNTSANNDDNNAENYISKDESTEDSSMEHRNVTKYTILNMLTQKDTLILLLVIWYMWTACNLTYYGIFMSSSDLAGNRFLNFCLLVIVEIPANFLVLYMMNRMGRLQVLRIFLSLAVVSLLSSLFLKEFFVDYTGSEIASVVLFIFGKFAITCFFNAIFIFTPEIFPTVIRSAGNGSCKSIPRIGSMLAPYSRPLYVVVQWAPGLIFASLCFIALILTYFLPETKDRILPTKLSEISKDKNKSFNKLRAVPIKIHTNAVV